MYGAIFGDIIGSRFEFDRGGKTKDFELFTNEDNFTDDTVMTIAVGEALLKAGKEATAEEIRRAVIDSMRAWGHKYPNAGYGGRFFDWLFYQRRPKPYGSYGNGSAMRVSAAGWLYDTLERTREIARATAEVTHNHPEGIKGAECTAVVMFLARTGHSKEDIREFVIREYQYDLSETLNQLRRRHRHDESCMDSLPKALTAFFEGSSYEDVIRNAVSLGGDTDTIAAIAGAMAEAMYGIPVMIFADGKTFIPEDMQQVLTDFENALGTRPQESADRYEHNEYIKMAVAQIYETNAENAYYTLLDVLAKRMQEEGEAPTPMVDVNHFTDNVKLDELCIGDSFSFDQDLHLQFDTMVDGNGDQWFPLFTDEKELHKGNTTNFIINASIQTILENGLTSERAKGVVINPFGQAITLPREILTILMKHVEER